MKLKSDEEQYIAIHHSPQELLAFCEASAEAIEGQEKEDNAELVVFFRDLAALCRVIIDSIHHEVVVPFAPKPNGPKS